MNPLLSLSLSQLWELVNERDVARSSIYADWDGQVSISSFKITFQLSLDFSFQNKIQTSANILGAKSLWVRPFVGFVQPAGPEELPPGHTQSSSLNLGYWLALISQDCRRSHLTTPLIVDPLVELGSVGLHIFQPLQSIRS